MCVFTACMCSTGLCILKLKVSRFSFVGISSPATVSTVSIRTGELVNALNERFGFPAFSCVDGTCSTTWSLALWKEPSCFLMRLPL